MDELKIALIQPDIIPEETGKNLSAFGDIISSQIKVQPDILFLPEMFNSGFSKNLTGTAEEMDGPSIKFISKIAVQLNCPVMATLVIKEEGLLFNRQVTVFPDKKVKYSDKRHLFRLSEEYKVMRRGNQKSIVEVNTWKISPLICFDLRFPVWSKNSFQDGKYEYDLLVYLSNWPASRTNTWRSLLVARAIENLSYVVGVNRIGVDGFGTEHTGNSMVINPKGEILWEAEAGESVVKEICLSKRELVKIREEVPFGPDWDNFIILSGK